MSPSEVILAVAGFALVTSVMVYWHRQRKTTLPSSADPLAAAARKLDEAVASFPERMADIQQASLEGQRQASLKYRESLVTARDGVLRQLGELAGARAESWVESRREALERHAHEIDAEIRSIDSHSGS